MTFAGSHPRLKGQCTGGPKFPEKTGECVPMSRSVPDVPANRLCGANADFSVRVFEETEPRNSVAPPEEGWRLVRAFLTIKSPKRREAILKYVADMARMDETERTH